MERWLEPWCALLPISIAEVLRKLDDESKLIEIRLRRNAPMELVFGASDRIIYGNNGSPMTTEADITEICARIQSFSAYAWENERRDGYLTVYGCRVGLAGRMVRSSDAVLGFSSVSGLCIRIVRESKDCAKPLLSYLVQDGEPLSVLLVSPPGCGKTTLLRDLVRILSDGLYGVCCKRVGVADERFELSGASDGSVPFDLGVRTDVISGIAKTDAVVRIVAALSPQVLAVDELNTVRDAEAVLDASGKGITVLATAHGRTWDDLRRRPMMRMLRKERVFERIVLLRGIGQCVAVLDADGQPVFA